LLVREVAGGTRFFFLGRDWDGWWWSSNIPSDDLVVRSGEICWWMKGGMRLIKVGSNVVSRFPGIGGGGRVVGRTEDGRSGWGSVNTRLGRGHPRFKL
jgi:hypothetical protein